MRGQWLGRFHATGWSGSATVEVDDLGKTFGGRVYLFSRDTNMPSAIAYFEVPKGDNPARAVAKILPIDPSTGNPTTWDALAHRFPQLSFATLAQTTLRWTQDRMVAVWDSNLGAHGRAFLYKSNAERASEYVETPMEWAQFKAHVACLEFRRFVFRGQAKRWRLRTHFHRTGRADLWKYNNEDMTLLHRHLSARTRHTFNRRDSDENGAFLHLAQHHGFPTPLLDWTYSPYVAAFFAYQKVPKQLSPADAGSRVRIYQFDRQKWTNDLIQIPKAAPARPHFSLLEFIAIENERMIPQQALSGLTNVDDVEDYIRSVERSNGTRYLSVIDLPAADRTMVMQELSTMGITAGALFPGLDGACEELRERLFP
ncbi:FRG domain-containing protein [Caballeronia sp. J97]|uniref:FRG domain-containing protein n=1 Tax=Caballeronia sp. J97 TaxID=2805429 RepID=UPI002AAFA339|nr:FRG domain-containing protein [Caballeronia sp. J97]